MAALGNIGAGGSLTGGGAMAAGGSSNLPAAMSVVLNAGAPALLTDAAIAAGASWPVASPLSGTLTGSISTPPAAVGVVTQPTAIVAVVKN